MFGGRSKFILPVAVGSAIIGGGIAAGSRSLKEHREEDDGISHAASNAVSGALYTGIGLGAAYVGAKAVTVGIKRPTVGEVVDSIHVPNILKHPSSFDKAMLTKPMVLAGAGAGLGAFAGYQLDKRNPKTGAAIGTVAGTGVGVAASAAIKGTHIWNKIGPVGRTGAIIAGAIAIGTGARALTHNEQYQNDDIAVSYGADVSSYGVKDRLTNMNASGDIVLGLNNKRR